MPFLCGVLPDDQARQTSRFQYCYGSGRAIQFLAMYRMFLKGEGKKRGLCSESGMAVDSGEHSRRESDRRELIDGCRGLERADPDGNAEFFGRGALVGASYRWNVVVVAT